MRNPTSFLHSENVIVDLSAASKSEAIHRVASLLKEKPQITDWVAFYDELVTREGEGSTYLGDGLAVPHSRTRHASDLAVSIGVSAQGIDFGNSANAHFIAIVAVPTTMADEYLQVVGSLARVLRKKSVRVQLLAGITSEKVVQLLKSEINSL